jgi:hypothetical protein
VGAPSSDDRACWLTCAGHALPPQYLGTFNSEEEAAKAYDVAAIKYRGVTAVINYSLANYDVEAIQAAPPGFPLPGDGDGAVAGTGAAGVTRKGKAKAAAALKEVKEAVREATPAYQVRTPTQSDQA